MQADTARQSRKHQEGDKISANCSSSGGSAQQRPVPAIMPLRPVGRPVGQGALLALLPPSLRTAKEGPHHLLVLFRLDAARAVASRPPGFTNTAAAASRKRWSSSSFASRPASKRHRASARRASTPELEHGASTSAASKLAGARPPACSAGRVSMISAPIRSAPATIRLRLEIDTSIAVMCPSLRISSASRTVLVPGAAQKSSTRSPGRAATARAASVAVGSCGCSRPERNAATASTLCSLSSTTLRPLACGRAVTPSAARASSAAATFP